MQVQNAIGIEALQTVRFQFHVFGTTSTSLHLLMVFFFFFLCSFELGGDKKTKGAALTFVRSRPALYFRVADRRFPLPSDSCSHHIFVLLHVHCMLAVAIKLYAVCKPANSFVLMRR
jgi:hypothetical protein